MNVKEEEKILYVPSVVQNQKVASSRMGCFLGKNIFKRDEVSPISVQPTIVSSAKEIPAPDGLIPHKENRLTTNMDSAVVASHPKPQQNGSAAPPPAFQMPEVEILRVPDGDGNCITLGKLLGGWTAPWPSLPEQFLRAQQFTFDDSDVILLGYAKSGSHWLWEMLHMLQKGRAEHDRTPKERLMISFSTQEFFDALEPPRVFNCHAPFVALPSALRTGQNKCKMVYMLRNPKDLAVSYYHHLKAQIDFDYEGNFSGFLHLFLDGKVPGGSWFDYVLGWEETLRNNPHLPVLVLHYEDVKDDTVSVLRKVNEFMGQGRGEDLLKEIAAECTIQKMKKVDEELKDNLAYVNVSKTGKNFMYRKGEVGDWRNWFTAADNDKFDKAIADRLKKSSLSFRYDLGPVQESESTRL